VCVCPLPFLQFFHAQQPPFLERPLTVAIDRDDQIRKSCLCRAIHALLNLSAETQILLCIPRPRTSFTLFFFWRRRFGSFLGALLVARIGYEYSLVILICICALFIPVGIFGMDGWVGDRMLVRGLNNWCYFDFARERCVACRAFSRWVFAREPCLSCRTYPVSGSVKGKVGSHRRLRSMAFNRPTLVSNFQVPAQKMSRGVKLTLKFTDVSSRAALFVFASHQKITETLASLRARKSTGKACFATWTCFPWRGSSSSGPETCGSR